MLDNNHNIKKLEELTLKLPTLPTFVASEDHGIVEYDVDPPGVCIGINLYNSGKVAVQRNLILANTIFKKHIHSTCEHIIVYEGELEVIYNDKTYVLKVGDSVLLPPYTEHSARAIVNSWIIAITIPAAPGYPK